MSVNKADIVSVLHPAYRECHETIVNILRHDLKTLYSCILVNRSFCRIFIPILWRNPFRFVKEDEKLIQVFNTLIHCLSTSDKDILINKEFINIEKLPTNKTYFEYHTLIKEFDLNPLQRGIRLWTSRNSLNPDDPSKCLTRRSISRRVIKLNNYIGDLLFNKGNQYESLNIYYNELLSGFKSLLDICKFENHEKSLAKVNKLSLGFFHGNSTNLVVPITERILRLQYTLSPNIQHLQIFIDTFKDHVEFTENLINFIQSQKNLKSLITNISWVKKEYTLPFIDALKKQSNSLTFLKLQDSTISISLFLSILNTLPNLITLELVSIKYERDEMFQNTLKFPSIRLNKLENLSYDCSTLSHLYSYSSYSNSYLKSSNVSNFERTLFSSCNKSFKTKYPFDDRLRSLPSNLTHLHLILDQLNAKCFGNLHNLIHLKLEALSKLDSLMSHTWNSVKDFLKDIPESLKILELNYKFTNSQLGILFNETQINLQCIKLYNYHHYKNTSLSGFIDYARRNPSFKELCISRDAMQNISEEHIREARNYFNITILGDDEIHIPFYETPILNSYWSNRINNKSNRTVPKDRNRNRNLTMWGMIRS